MLLICSNIFAQNLKDFTGIYSVTQRCWEFNNNFEEITEYEVEVNYATNDSTNLEMQVIFFKPYTLGFNVKNDSLFWINNHLFLNADSTIQYVSGNGIIYQDSIDLNMSTASINDVFNCHCNGNKVRDVDVGIEDNILLNKGITLYSNPATSELQVRWHLLPGNAYNFYQIYNVVGQCVIASKSQLFESIDVHNLKAGTYIIHFLADEVSVASGRFVKME